MMKSNLICDVDVKSISFNVCFLFFAVDAVNCVIVAKQDRRDCGYSHDQSQCESNGCCFKYEWTVAKDICFYPARKLTLAFSIEVKVKLISILDRNGNPIAIVEVKVKPIAIRKPYDSSNRSECVNLVTVV